VAAREGDWAGQTADTIERVVGSVRDKTTGPLERFARLLVYGLVAAVLGVAILVLAAVALVRGLDLLIPGEVWSAHLVTGGIFTLAGLFLWRKRTVKTVKA
jgi:predicted metal-binding membrane protein